MSRLALPCIACGRELRNVDETATNQPYGGTAFETHGHYGSTIYDPIDGHYIEINVCDICLATHADRVYEGRDYRPIMEAGTQVGITKLDPPYKLVPWYIRGKQFDWTIKQTRKEFSLVVDDTDEEDEYDTTG